MYVHNEYDSLKTVLMSSPVEGFPNIHFNTAVQTLKKYGVDVRNLTGAVDRASQVFTRDIGFVIDGILYSGSLAPHRQKEREAFHRELDKSKIRYTNLFNHIEGGDVIVHNEIVFVGVSGRTTAEGVSELQSHLGTKKQVIPVRFHPRYLHLDCIFNVLSKDYCVVYPGAIDHDFWKCLTRRFSHIGLIPASEQASLASNFLSIQPGLVMAARHNPLTNGILRVWGWKVLEMNVDEFVQNRGGIRCMTQPWKRMG